MVYVSLVIVALLLSVNAVTGHEANRAISLELRDGNPSAWLLMAALSVLIVLFARRLNRNKYSMRASLLLLDIFVLIGMAFVPGQLMVQAVVLFFVSILTLMWFSVVALDLDCPHVGALAGVCFLALPLFSIGMAEKALVLYAVYATNVLYHLHLDPKGRKRWP